MHEKDGGAGIFCFQNFCVKLDAVVCRDANVARSERFKPSGFRPTLLAEGSDHAVIIERGRIQRHFFCGVFFRCAVKCAKKEDGCCRGGKNKERGEDAEDGV